MLPTTSLDGSDVNSHDSHNDVSLFYEDGCFDSPQNGKTLTQTNVKDVQKASNRAEQINTLNIKLRQHQ
jgi:hypothetical protein